jgi:pimeloyl-ACP methyl ester carboxylesterase
MSPTPSYSLFEKERELGVSDGTPIRYTIRGSGDGLAVVLANGWSCSDSYWVHLLPYLEQQGYRVVLPDPRGHGESGLPRPPGFKGRNITVDDMSVERFALDLIEVCRHEGIEQAVFAGHSMGVQTIFEAYRQAPRMVAGLIPIAGPYENPLKTFYGGSFIERVFPIGQLAITAIPSWFLAAYWKVGNNAAFGLRMAQLARAAGPKVTKEGLAPYITHLSTRDPVILFKAIEGMRRHSAADLLPDVNVPVLIIAGGQDTFTPPSLQQHLHDVLPDSELVMFDDGHHTLPLEEPDAINEAVGRFLERVATKSAAEVGAG